MTSAAEKGATADRITDRTGHRSVVMVRVYASTASPTMRVRGCSSSIALPHRQPREPEGEEGGGGGFWNQDQVVAHGWFGEVAEAVIVLDCYDAPTVVAEERLANLGSAGLVIVVPNGLVWIGRGGPKEAVKRVHSRPSIIDLERGVSRALVRGDGVSHEKITHLRPSPVPESQGGPATHVRHYVVEGETHRRGEVEPPEPSYIVQREERIPRGEKILLDQRRTSRGRSEEREAQGHRDGMFHGGLRSKPHIPAEKYLRPQGPQSTAIANPANRRASVGTWAGRRRSTVPRRCRASCPP